MLVLVRDYAGDPRRRSSASWNSAGTLPPFTALFTYMFFHAGWSHIIGNMLFLWVLGDNLEDAFGSVRFFLFFILCGAAGGIAHLLSTPNSVAPLIGASGSVAGIVAAYLMLRPCARITILLFGFIPISLGSTWVLGFWVLAQIWNVVSAAGGDTAWWAHIGGFAAGALLTLVFRRRDVMLFECIRPGDVIVAKAEIPGLKRRWGSR